MLVACSSSSSDGGALPIQKTLKFKLISISTFAIESFRSDIIRRGPIGSALRTSLECHHLCDAFIEHALACMYVYLTT